MRNTINNKKSIKGFYVPNWAVYAVVFGLVGVGLLAFTSAAPGGKGGGGDAGTNVYFYANANSINLPSDGSITLEQTALTLGGGFAGNITAARLSVGDSFLFGGKGGAVDNPLQYTLLETCYVMTATTSDAVLNVDNGGNYESITVKKAPDGSGGNWQKTCVNPPRKGGQTSKTVEHVSGGEVLFYEMQRTYSANY